MYMGADTGGMGGEASPLSESRRGTSPRNRDCLKFFFNNLSKTFFKIFKIKRPKSEEKSEFGGR